MNKSFVLMRPYPHGPIVRAYADLADVRNANDSWFLALPCPNIHKPICNIESWHFIDFW